MPIDSIPRAVSTDQQTPAQPKSKRSALSVIRLAVFAVLIILVLVIIAGTVAGLQNSITILSDADCGGYNCMDFEATQEDGFATWEVQPGWPLFLTVSGSAGNEGDDVTIRCPNRQDSEDLLAKMMQLFDKEAIQDCRVI